MLDFIARRPSLMFVIFPLLIGAIASASIASPTLEISERTTKFNTLMAQLDE